MRTKLIMNNTGYQIDLPQNSPVVVFYNGIKALNLKGFWWLWKQILTGNQIAARQAKGCKEAKIAICSPKEVVIVSYWEDEASLREFFHSPLHRQMMKSMREIIVAEPNAIAVFNETHRPLRSGKYINEPQGLAKIYPMQEQLSTK
jgi:heme-degrading monooxygenase HmoA